MNILIAFITVLLYIIITPAFTREISLAVVIFTILEKLLKYHQPQILHASVKVNLLVIGTCLQKIIKIIKLITLMEQQNQNQFVKYMEMPSRIRLNLGILLFLLLF